MLKACLRKATHPKKIESFHDSLMQYNGSGINLLNEETKRDFFFPTKKLILHNDLVVKQPKEDS